MGRSEGWVGYSHASTRASNQDASPLCVTASKKHNVSLVHQSRRCMLRSGSTHRRRLLLAMMLSLVLPAEEVEELR